jgi:predicted amidohydrolase YtcJ
MHPSLILHNAKIYTVDESQPWAQAVAIVDNKITAVGDDRTILALKGSGTQLIDLENRLVLPGFCDAHIHLYDWSLSRNQVPLGNCASLDEMVGNIYQWVEKNRASRWVSGRGWNENDWVEKRMPARRDIESATGKHRPALFWRSDMHCAVANGAALELAGINSETPDPAGGRIGRYDDGSPNGLLWELAINLVSSLIPDPEPGELDTWIASGIAELNRLGVTAVHDQRMKDQHEGPLALASYQRLAREDKLTIRINFNVAAHDLSHLSALGIRSGFGDSTIRIGHLKLFADGTLGSQTAWMLDPFSGEKSNKAEEYGINLTPPATMAAEIQQASILGIPTSVHAIGDRANREVLDIFEELAQARPQPSIPHRIEHVQIIDPDDLPRLAKLGITASMQPIHILDDMDMADILLQDRASRAYRVGSLAKSGALLALGSDAPVADPNPFLGIHGAITRQRPDRMEVGRWYDNERITLEQALYGYTAGPALASGWHNVIGAISPGKRADMIVLDRDIFQIVDRGIKENELVDTRIEMTLFDGQFIEHEMNP